MDKLMVVLGINENVGKGQNPNVPLDPHEIASDIAACVEAGVSLVHFHARDPKTGNSVNDPDLHLEIYRAVQKQADVVIYPSVPTDFRHVLAAIRAPDIHPEVGPVIAPPLTVWATPDRASRSFVLPGNAEEPGAPIRAMYDAFVSQTELCRRYGLWVSHDVMEPAGVRNVQALDEMGYYERPVLLKFFMSEEYIYGPPPLPRYLQAYVEMIPASLNCEWLALPYGVSHRSAMALWAHAITHGGHVRVGIGDNPSGEGYLPRNVDRVREIVDLACRLGREIATVADVRERFKPFKEPPAGEDRDPAKAPSASAGWANHVLGQ